MAKTVPELDGPLRRFIEAQAVFFVASAPLDARGHVNLSPKGLDTFRVLGPTSVAYLDLTGSGVETIAHLRENGRIVVLFCAFDGPPKILRLHGLGTVVEPGDPAYSGLLARFPAHDGARAIIRIELTRISTSCGMSVPLMRLEGPRDQLSAWARRKGDDGLRAYRREKNAASLDGLPGLV